MDDKVGEGSATIFPQHNYSTATAAANGFPVLYASGSNCGFSYSPLNAPFSCNLSNFNSADSANPIRARTKSYAGYGQVSYTIDEKLTFTAGARYTVDDKDYRQPAQVGGTFTTFVGTYVAQQNAAALAAGQPIPFPDPNGYHAVFPFNKDRATFANFDCGGLTPGDFAPAGSNTVVAQCPTTSSRAAASASSNTGPIVWRPIIRSLQTAWSTSAIRLASTRAASVPHSPPPPFRRAPSPPMMQRGCALSRSARRTPSLIAGYR